MYKMKVNVNTMQTYLRNQEKRFTKKQKVITNEAARRLQKYVQQSIEDEDRVDTGLMSSINRGGIHKQKLANGKGYRVYMKPYYAIFQELGTKRGIQPSHFFQKAVEKFDRAYTRIARDLITYL